LQDFAKLAQDFFIDDCIDCELLSTRDKFILKISYVCPGSVSVASPVSSFPLDLYIVGIDDSLIGRKMLKKLFEKLGAKKSVIMGSVGTLAELEEAERLVISGGDGRPQLVFLDQNIQTKDNRTIFGTDITKRLREKGYDGFIVIASANASSDDIVWYSELGTVDCVLGKHMSLQMKKSAVIKAYLEKDSRRR